MAATLVAAVTLYLMMVGVDWTVRILRVRSIYLTMAARHTKLEQQSRSLQKTWEADAARATTQAEGTEAYRVRVKEVKQLREQARLVSRAAYYRALLRRNYERAASRPWEYVRPSFR
jgi:hypothetical protein